MSYITMDFVIFSFIVLIIKCYACQHQLQLSRTENSHALSPSLSSNEPINVVYYTAVTNKPLDLPFHDVSVSFGSCHKFHDRAVRLEATISNSMIHIDNVTHSMSALWECIVMENLSNYYMEPRQLLLFLNLHVKGAKSVEITLNGNKLTFSEADLEAPYDGDTIYFYEDGERMQVVCRNPHSTGSVHLVYFTKDATTISNSATFSIELHSGSNGSYIDCVYNTTKPADTYVYRVTFVTNKRLFYLNENKSLTNVKIPGQSSSLILGSSIGAVLVILGLTGVACWYVRTRNAKHTATPNGDITYQNDIPTHTLHENQYDTCHYSENLSNRETYYEGSVENNIDPEDHYYTKINYSHCIPKIGETQTRNSKVYDEPYVHITIRDRMQAIQGV